MTKVLADLETKWVEAMRQAAHSVVERTQSVTNMFEKLRSDTETKFRTSMKTAGSPMSKEQQALGEPVDALEVTLALPKDCTRGAQASATRFEGETTRAQGRAAHGSVYLASCIYVAVTLFRHPATKTDEEDQAMKGKLLSVLKSIPTDAMPTGAEAWYGAVYVSMRATAGRGAPVGTGVAFSSAPSGQEKSAVVFPSGLEKKTAVLPSGLEQNKLVGVLTLSDESCGISSKSPWHPSTLR